MARNGSDWTAFFGGLSPLSGRTRAALGPRSLIALPLVCTALAACAGDDRPDPPDFLLNGAAAIAAGQCPDDLPESSDCAAASPSYASEVKTLIEQRCLGCHFPGNTQSSKVFDDYARIQAERRGMLTQIYGCDMPPDGAVELSLEERRTLLKWFVCGAPDN